MCIRDSSHNGGAPGPQARLLRRIAPDLWHQVDAGALLHPNTLCCVEALAENARREVHLRA
eukprot:4327269-Alexandrium_andersonii.AAC.1